MVSPTKPNSYLTSTLLDLFVVKKAPAPKALLSLYCTCVSDPAGLVLPPPAGTAQLLSPLKNVVASGVPPASSNTKIPFKCVAVIDVLPIVTVLSPVPTALYPIMIWFVALALLATALTPKAVL